MSRNIVVLGLSQQGKSTFINVANSPHDRYIKTLETGFGVNSVTKEPVIINLGNGVSLIDTPGLSDTKDEELAFKSIVKMVDDLKINSVSGILLILKYQQPFTQELIMAIKFYSHLFMNPSVNIMITCDPGVQGDVELDNERDISLKKTVDEIYSLLNDFDHNKIRIESVNLRPKNVDWLKTKNIVDNFLLDISLIDYELNQLIMKPLKWVREDELIFAKAEGELKGVEETVNLMDAKCGEALKLSGKIEDKIGKLKSEIELLNLNIKRLKTKKVVYHEKLTKNPNYFKIFKFIFWDENDLIINLDCDILDEPVCSDPNVKYEILNPRCIRIIKEDWILSSKINCTLVIYGDGNKMNDNEIKEEQSKIESKIKIIMDEEEELAIIRSNLGKYRGTLNNLQIQVSNLKEIKRNASKEYITFDEFSKRTRSL